MGFLDELAQINASNYLSGLRNEAQAIEGERDNEKIVQYADMFTRQQAVLNQSLKTKNEIVTGVNEQLGKIQDKKLTMEQQADEFRRLMYTSLDRMGAYNNLYQPFITAFATLGPDGARIANSLTNELKGKIQQEENKMKIPILETENRLQNAQIASHLLSTEVAQFNFDRAKEKWGKDQQAQKVLADMFKDSDGQQLWSWLTGAEYQGSAIEDDPQYKPTFDRFMEKFQNLPGFSTAWQIFSANPRVQRKSILMPKNTGKGSITGNPVYDNILDQFSQLQDASRLWSNIHSLNGPIWKQARNIITKNQTPDDLASTMNALAAGNPVRQVLKNYTDWFLTSGPKSYHTKFKKLSDELAGFGKKLQFDTMLTLPNGMAVGAGKDLLFFDKQGNPTYEPYLYYKGFYDKQHAPSYLTQQPRENMFAPKTATPSSTGVNTQMPGLYQR